MKVSKIIYLILTCVICLGQVVNAQSNSGLVKAKILKNMPFTFEVESYTLPTLAFNQEYGHITQFQYTNSSNSPYGLRVIIEQDFLGTAYFAVEWTKTINTFPFIEPQLTFYEIEVVESIIDTEVDVVNFMPGQGSIEIYPLDNDYAGNAPLSLLSVAHVMYGTAIVTDSNTIIYTPSNTYSGADYLVYSVLDTINESESGNIIINVMDENPAISDSLDFTITDVQSQLIVFPFDGLKFDNGANHGQLDSISTHAFRYTPNLNFNGVDTLNFVSEVGFNRQIRINVLSVTEEPGYAIDDYYYTLRETEVIIKPLLNDVKSSFPIISISPELEYVSAGVYSYTPVEGFDGLKVFNYTIDYFFGTATGKIYVNVSNYEPQSTFAYTFSTAKGQPLVIKYEVPITDYEFVAPSFSTGNGFVIAYGDDQNATVGCDDVNGEAFFIYYPNAGFAGIDNFEIEYCTSTECITYDVEVEVVDVDGEVCFCVNDCVWEGDTNADGKVNVSDLLPIGRNMGLAGPSRSSIYDFWSAGDTENWTYNQFSGKNIKHADANGDGIITVADTNSISAYYNKLHNFVPNEVLTVKNYPFYLDFLNDVVDTGELLLFDIYLGTPGFPVKDLHGLSFSVQIGPVLSDSLVVDSSSMFVQFYEDGWLTAVGPSIQMDYTPSNGKIDAAVTRTDGIPSSGFGVIGQLGFIVEDEALGIKPENEEVVFALKIKNATGATADGSGFYMPDLGMRLSYNRSGKSVKIIDTEVVENELTVSPNPASNSFNIDLSHASEVVNSIYLTDISGRSVAVTASNNNVDVSNFPVGLYIMTVMTDMNTYNQKVQVIR